MGREEQKEERELVLPSIFPDEITDVNESEYRIQMVLDLESSPDEHEEAPILLLNVRYPEAYPDVAPILDVTQPPNAPKHTFLDIQEDKAQLLEGLQPTIEENLGIAMIFTLYSTLKDAAEQLISDRKKVKQDAHDLEVRKAEEEENRKFEGEKVSPQSFLDWRERFRQELADEKAKLLAEVEAEEKKKRGKLEEKKLSGRQLWEQGLAGKTTYEEEDGEDAIAHGMQQLDVKA